MGKSIQYPASYKADAVDLVPQGGSSSIETSMPLVTHVSIPAAKDQAP